MILRKAAGCIFYRPFRIYETGRGEVRVTGGRGEGEKVCPVVDGRFYMGDVTVMGNIFFTFLANKNINFKYARIN